MRISGGLPITAALLALAGPALAQQASGPIRADQREIGRVETRVQRYDQALGVITRLVRPLGAEAECYGICFFPSSTRPTAWRCGPQEGCDLHCDVNPPAGGCSAR